MQNNIVSLLRMRREDFTPEVKFFIVSLCYHIEKAENPFYVESIQALANLLGVSASTAKDGIRYLESQDFLCCDKRALDEDSPAIQLEFTEEFFLYLSTLPPFEVHEDISDRIGNLLRSDSFKELSKRVAVKLFLLTLLAHSDAFGIVRDLSIKDLKELMGRFSKDRHRSQLSLLRKSGYILAYNAGMSGGVILGKQKSEYWINTSHKEMANAATSETKPHIIFENKNSSCFIALRLSKLISEIQKEDIPDNPTAKKINTLISDLLPDDANTEETSQLYQALKVVGNAFSGEVRGFQVQRYILTITFQHLVKFGWALPDATEICDALKFEELFSDKFLRETLQELIGENEKISQKPLREQTEHYLKLQDYMECSMNVDISPQIVITHSGFITAITKIMACCAVYTAKCLIYYAEKDASIQKLKNVTLFQDHEDIKLYFY